MLEKMPPGTPCVCESNSLAAVVKPGVFVMVKDRSSDEYKESARRVIDYADKIVMSDEAKPDFDFSRIDFVNGAWSILERASAIILAGGSSSRMGLDKIMLPIGGMPLVQYVMRQLEPHFEEILVSSNQKSALEFLDVPIVPDIRQGQGPLMGIFSSLLHSSNETNAVVACDIPDVNLTLLRRMIQEASACDALIPKGADEMFEPLFAVYNKSILPAMRKVLTGKGRRIAHVFELANVKFYPLGDSQRLSNLNTRADYDNFIADSDPDA